jgi:hypothetical protein
MSWQLRKLSTNEIISEEENLPENWGPIFGLQGIPEKLGDLSWLGEKYADMGWVEVEDSPEIIKQRKVSCIEKEVARLLEDSNWTMLEDAEMTAETKALWREYRRSLRRLHLQPRFPEEVSWPKRPTI